MRTPSGVGAIEYRSDFEIWVQVIATAAITNGMPTPSEMPRTPSHASGPPSDRIAGTANAMVMPNSTRKNTSHSSPASSCDPIRRPVGIFTTLSGATSARSTPSMRPLTPLFIEPTSWERIVSGAAAFCERSCRAARAARAPEANRRMSARTPSALTVERYSSGTFASVPAPTTSSLAIPIRRAGKGRVRLTPCTRSRGARRWERKMMPLRTSTWSSEMRNCWNRQTIQNAAMSTSSTPSTIPRAMRMKLFDSTQSTGSPAV